MKGILEFDLDLRIERSRFDAAFNAALAVDTSTPYPAPEPLDLTSETPESAPTLEPFPAPPVSVEPLAVLVGHLDYVSTRLEVQGNRLISERGEWQGRGVNLFCTRSCDACSYEPDRGAALLEAQRRLNFAATQLGCNFVRLVLSSYPEAGGRASWLPPSKDLAYLEEISILVESAQRLGLQVMITDTIDQGYDTNGHPTQASLTNVIALAYRLGNCSNVWFSLCNEPRWSVNGTLDAAYIDTALDAVRQIRIPAPNSIVAVQAPRMWARYLGMLQTPAVAEQFKALGPVVFDIHPYSSAAGFQEQFVSPALNPALPPIVLSEFGPTEYMSFEDANEAIRLANEHKITWAGWSMHHRCPPSMFENLGACGIGDPLVLTPWGETAKAGIARLV